MRQNSSGRLPLKPRHPNVEAGIRSSNSSVGSNMSRTSSKASLPSFTSRASSADNPSKYSYVLESSGNENNQRMTTLASAALTSSTLKKLSDNAGGSSGGEGGGADGGGGADRDSSVVAETGQRIASSAPSLMGVAKPGRGGVGVPPLRHPSPAPGAATASSKVDRPPREHRARSGSTPREPRAPPPPSRSRSDGSVRRGSGSSGDEVIIEERRRHSSGDGHSVHKYARGRLLGTGGFAKVYWCTSLDTNRNFAVKVVPKANLVKSRTRQKLQAEIKIHRTLKHKHICDFKHFFEDKTNCYILLELCQNQSMNELIKRRKRLTETEVRYYMLQLLDAVRYMHGRNVIHRDLKLGNVFLDKQLRVKVGDLGLATKLSSAEEKRTTICGTPNYIAPEIIDGKKEGRGHSFEVDVWSMGVICYAALVGKPPYESKDVKSTYQRILANKYSFPSHFPISEHARDLISSMLQTKPEKRLSLEQIISHPFLTHTGGRLPRTLPQSCVHTAPEWEDDGLGNLVVVEKGSGEENQNPSRSSSSSCRRKKHTDAESKVAPVRQPLSSRDPNVGEGKGGKGGAEKYEKIPARTSHPTRGREIERAPDGRRGRSLVRSPPRVPERTKPSSQPFRIYNDGKGTEIAEDRERERKDLPPPPPPLLPLTKSRHKESPQSRPDDAKDELDDIIQKVSACALEPERKLALASASASADPHYAHGAEQTASLTAPNSAAGGGGSSGKAVQEKEEAPAPPVDQDTQVLEAMHVRLCEMFKRMEIGNGADDDDLLFSRFSAGAVSDDVGWGASKWVTRYVDYTSKYGLGFLLNDGSAGVYFNDSTKAVLAAKGEKFVYVERRKTTSHGNDGGDEKHAPVRTETMCEPHTLSSYPESLQKKVTLLKHFRNYLVEQQKRAVEEEGVEDIFSTSFDFDNGNEVDPSSLVYLKKWVRTKHAILFRMSNKTVQVVFYDHTEVLLSSEARVITYVDKTHRRKTYHLHEIMMESNAEISKRLKYAKDILQQLISGTKH